MIYEAGLLGLPLFFYTFDMESYGHNRGLAIDYAAEMPGIISGDPGEIMEAIRQEKFCIEDVVKFTNRYVEETDGATKKIAGFALSVGRIKRER